MGRNNLVVFFLSFLTYGIKIGFALEETVIHFNQSETTMKRSFRNTLESAFNFYSGTVNGKKIVDGRFRHQVG